MRDRTTFIVEANDLFFVPSDFESLRELENAKEFVIT
jgi:hypothetical protein